MDPTVSQQVVAGDVPALQPGFQPRFVLMARLNRASQTPPVMLTGSWGTGKTQLAAAYARARLADGWRFIAWVNAGDSETLLNGLAAVAEAAGLSIGGSQPGAADMGQAVRCWLEADGTDRLLVFDGVEDPGLVRPFVPAAGAARVLITVDREPTPDLGTSVPVHVFSAEESLALLDGRTGLADEAGASAVAAELGYLPLSLDHAAAVITEQSLDYKGYLARLRALRAVGSLVRREQGEEQPFSSAAPEAVLLSLEAASAADPLGVCTGVTELVAMLSPAVVPCDLLRAAGQAGALLGGGRRLAAPMVDQAVERLNERSLLGFSLDGQVVSMHCLVARVARGWLARRGRLTTAVRAAASALEGVAVALAKPPDHTAVGNMLGQVTALLENVGAATGNADDKLTSALMRVRFLSLDHLMELGDSMPRVIAIAEPLIADLKVLLSADHPDTLYVRNCLAVAYRDTGRNAEAIQLFEQVLAGRERLFGPDDLDTMRSRSYLAGAYREAGRIADAVPLVEKTLAAKEHRWGAEHPATLASRNNLASAYRATGRPVEAIPLLEKNVAVCERLLGADHPKTLASRHGLELARQEARQPRNEEPPTAG